MFFTVEGIEASGKSTLIASLAARFAQEGLEVVLTREPGGTALGDRVRAIFLDAALPSDPLAEVFLVNASRAHLVVEVIRPALQAGRTVLCDRYTDATLAYQGYGRGLELKTLRALCDIATGGLVPAKTLLIDLPTEAALERLGAREGTKDRVEQEAAAFHRRVRDGYLALAAGNPRFTVIDGSQPPGAVCEDAWRALATVRS